MIDNFDLDGDSKVHSRGGCTGEGDDDVIGAPTSEWTRRVCFGKNPNSPSRRSGDSVTRVPTDEILVSFSSSKSLVCSYLIFSIPSRVITPRCADATDRVPPPSYY
ncbi:hypothetical protein ASPCAL04067 [Aspergillus calidoustus]|uniref:Uncharacterized protein n=1 Tax=Aspergillus calidoustus TaxID=454130 RepID=A0A0U5FXN2_ASPCI|nr:hypothetical protein ASPCAL04067 [Aspergillus calidoustus]